jgi:acetylornithine deacetylase/succinyl-diaminopimelate desuccinylase-like protein
VPDRPRTTLTVARLGGGTSINSIPSESWLEIDLRSEDVSALEDMEVVIRQALGRSLAREQRQPGDRLRVSVQMIGERPPGEVRPAHPLVQAAADATRSIGEEPEPAISSTDANVPLALGIPSIAIGGGGASGDTHTEHEWFEDTDGAAGAVRLLSIVDKVSRF